MKLKVKVRRQDRQTIIPTIIVMIIFSLIGVFCVHGIIESFIPFDIDYFFKIVSKAGLGFMILFCLGMVGFYLVYLFFKFPRKYLGTLIKKENITYKGKNVWNMEFSVKGEKNYSLNMSCYTEKENEFDIDKEYILEIKEFRTVIKSISNYTGKEKFNYLKGPTLMPVFLMFFFSFGFGTVFLLLKILYDLKNGNNYLINLIPLGLCAVVFRFTYELYLVCNNDDNKE